MEPTATPEPAHSRWKLPASRTTPQEPTAQEPTAQEPQTQREKTLARQVAWRKARKEADFVALRDVGHEVYLCERRQIVELMTVQVPRQCRCKTNGCDGKFRLTGSTTTGHGGSVVMWFRCSDCSRRCA